MKITIYPNENKNLYSELKLEDLQIGKIFYCMNRFDDSEHALMISQNHKGELFMINLISGNTQRLVNPDPLAYEKSVPYIDTFETTKQLFEAMKLTFDIICETKIEFS